ncbi:MAG: hypothetical protein FIB08_02195 [Candidatus Methanoperedens sp.]|nr:hypothetical protein [Candidatus Methanoperedens sp.]
MIVTRHISLDKDCIEKIEPYVQKHNGNFSAAIREIIDEADKSRSSKNVAIIDNSLFKWMLDEMNGLLVPENVLDELIDPSLINSMRKLEDHLKCKFKELDWDIGVVIKSDKDNSPSNVHIEIKGHNQKIKLIACILSQYLVKSSAGQSPLEVVSVSESEGYINIGLSKTNNKDAISSVINFFGDMDEVTNAIKSNPDFWKTVINRHVLSNYNMVTIHRNYFEDLLAGKIPMGEIAIETMARKPIHEIPLKEMLSLVKEVYETSRVVDRVEIDRESIIMFHNYRNTDVIEKLKKSLVTLMEANGHLYDAKSTANMIVLDHRPDVGIKINEIVDNLKISNSRVDQELIVFMAFLKGLKDMPDISLSLTVLGRRIGKSLMQEYEKEKGIKSWNMETLKNAFEIIHSKLRIESEWIAEKKNLLYTVRKCNIVDEGNTIDVYACQTIQEVFKGALNYAFGNKAWFEIKKSLIKGDSFCEVLIQLS